MGLKAVAIYRDNCKVAQPLSMARKDGKDNATQTELAADKAAAAAAQSIATSAQPVQPTNADEVIAATAQATDKFAVKGAIRRKLPRRRNSRTYKFNISDLKGYFTVSEYETGAPGELFISVSKQGSTLAGLMDSFAITFSQGLQYGVPLKSYVRTLMSSSFAPSGITNDEDIRTASSITDYIVRRLALDYLSFDDRLELGLARIEDMPDTQTSMLTDDQSTSGHMIHDAPQTVTEGATSAQAPALQAQMASTMANASVGPQSRASSALKDDQTVSPNRLPGISTAADTTAPLCYNCGNQTQRAGSCYVCTSCGSTTGCS